MTISRALLAGTLLGVAACSDLNLPDAIFPNVVDTLVLSSITDTPVHEPSAYSIPDSRRVRTDLTASFDFAYLRDGSRHLIVPLDGFNLGGRSTNPGLLPSGSAFDLIVDPPANGYNTTDSVAVAVGDVLVARSRVTCFLGVPQYAKLEVLAFDAAARTMTFRIVSNTNCGYRSLALGIPQE
jgi:hypothetical protein